jgi:hypothetical protein
VFVVCLLVDDSLGFFSCSDRGLDEEVHMPGCSSGTCGRCQACHEIMLRRKALGRRKCPVQPCAALCSPVQPCAALATVGSPVVSLGGSGCIEHVHAFVAVDCNGPWAMGHACGTACFFHWQAMGTPSPSGFPRG